MKFCVGNRVYNFLPNATSSKPDKPPNCLNFPPDTNNIEHAVATVVVVLNPLLRNATQRKLVRQRVRGNFCIDGLFTTTAPTEQNHLSGAGWLAGCWCDVVTATEFTGIYCYHRYQKENFTIIESQVFPRTAPLECWLVCRSKASLRLLVEW